MKKILLVLWIVGAALNTLQAITYYVTTGGNDGNSGTNWGTTFSGTTIIPANKSFLDITTTPVDDITIEGSESITSTLADDANYDVGASTRASITITDDDPILGGDNNILWNQLYHAANGVNPTTEQVPGQIYTFRVEGGNTAETFITALTDNLDAASATIRFWDGSAATAVPMTRVGTTTAAFRSQGSRTYDIWRGAIPAYPAGTTIYYRIIVQDGSASAYLKVNNGQYINPFGQHIRGFNDDPDDYFYTIAVPSVTIAAQDANAAEAGTDIGTFRITRSFASANALDVSYNIGGTAATDGSDYMPMLSGTATIPANETFVDITITPEDDAIYESNETVTLTLVDETTYDLGATTSATVTIADNEAAPMYASADFTFLDNEYFINTPFVLQIDNIKDQYGNPYVPTTITYLTDASSGIQYPVFGPPYSIVFTYSNTGNYTIKVFIDNVEAYSKDITVGYIPLFSSADFSVSPPAAPFGTPVTATIANLKDQFNNPYTPSSVTADVYQSNVLIASVTPTGSGAGPYTFVYNMAVGDYDVQFYVDGVLRHTRSFSVICPATSTLYVNAANNNPVDGTDWNKAYNKLQDALTVACGCSNVTEIWVAQGTYYPDEGIGQTDNDRNSTFQLCNGVKIYGGFNGTEAALRDRNVTANVTILSGDLDKNDGPNFANNDNNAYHVVTGSGTDATALLDGFTITAGNGNGGGNNQNGSGMFNNGGSPSVMNCTFSGNRTENVGGGMLNTNNSSPSVTYCTFSGNSASSGGGMFNFSSSPILTNCTFSGNSASSEGGGMFNASSSPSLTNCTFSGNSASSGGGMFNSGSSSPMVTDCIFSGNSASSGGGMYNDGGSSSPSLTNCTFSGNSASSSFDGGGGMFNFSSSPSLTNCTFSGNSASNAGSGVYNQFSSPSLTNCTFSGNSASSGGGGMFNRDSSPAITNCTFSGNSASSGGGMFNVDNSPRLTNCTFSGNSAGSGGGMFNFSGSPSLTNCIIWNNRANGVTTSTSASVFNSSATPTIAYSLIANSGGSSSWQSALGTDGGNNKDVDPQFVDADGADNTVGTLDDDLRLLPSSPAINMGNNNVDIDGDNGNQTIQDIATDLGGTPRILQNTVDMGAYEQLGCPSGTDLTLFVNAAAADGGDGSSWNTAYNKLQDALYFACNCGNVNEIWVAQGTYYPSVGVDFNSNSTIEDQEATFQLCNNVALYGGFAGNEDPNSFDLADRDFVTNETILSGDIDGDDAPFDPTTDDDNDTNTPSQTDHINGNNAYHVVTGSGTDATAVLDGFTITGSNANVVNSNVVDLNDNGGGMYNDGGSPTLNNCTFQGNLARFGGGMHNINASSPTLSNCIFQYNSAVVGGGIHSTGSSSPTLSNCTIQSNTSTNGGGMYNNNASAPMLGNCVFRDNVATNQGGGMYNQNSPLLTLTNCIFQNNSATFGGVMFNVSSLPTLSNCTFQGNTVDIDGSVMYNSNSSPTLSNCILFGNTSPNATPLFFNTGNSNPNISYSLVDVVDCNAVNVGSGGGTCGDGMIFNGDPLFVDAANGDLRLQPSSPAINMGDNSAVPADTYDVDNDGNTTEPTPDLDLNDRIVASIVDMGAYESPCPTISAEIAGTTTICPSGSTNLKVTISGGTAPYTVIYSPDGGTTEVTVNDYESGVNISVTPGATTTYTLIAVTDANGCVATTLSGSALVTVEDKTPPTAVCKAATITLNDNGTYTLQASEVNNGSSDNCSSVKYTLSKTDFSCADIGDRKVKLTVEDEAGLIDDCEANVKVLASSACPASITNQGGLTIADPCTCSAIPGYFDEEIVITGNAVGESWKLSANSGFINPDTGTPFAVGTAFIDNGNGTYSLVGRHQSGVGYNITATSEFYPNDPQAISNTCLYPTVEAGGADHHLPNQSGESGRCWLANECNGCVEHFG